MTFRTSKLFAALLVGSVGLFAVSSAQALTMKECSAKYKAAQAAGTLGGMKWNEFRKAQCGAGATADAAAPAAAPTEAGKPAAAPPAADAGKDFKATPPAAAPAAAPASAPAAAAATPAATEGSAGSAVFPSAVDAKYASEKPGKARMKTCLDQYNANKATNGNGGLKWIQKGGGYFSECSKRLKGQ